MERAIGIAEQIYLDVRSDILHCRVRPDEKLRTNELGGRYGASLSAVREALCRLSAEGLAIADPRRGFRVAPLSRTDLAQLSEAIMGIEAMCIRRSLTNGDAAWESRLEEACRAVENEPSREADNPDRLSTAFAAAHAEFHEALISACDNAWLLRSRRILDAQGHRYRQLCVPLAPAHSGHARHYRAILAAALARDIEATTAIVMSRYVANAELFDRVLAQAGGEMRFWSEAGGRGLALAGGAPLAV